MISVIADEAKADHQHVLMAMHVDRKKVFVDLLKWDVPVVEDQYEIDQFDNEHATYLLVTDATRSRHLGSVRLLPTTKPHILGDIFPELCADDVPTGPEVVEITRLCISPEVGSLRQGMAVRRELAIGLTEYALLHGIERYTLVTNSVHLPQLLAIGWDCEPLGLPRMIQGGMICAMQINITPATLALLRQNRRSGRPVLDLEQPMALAA